MPRKFKLTLSISANFHKAVKLIIISLCLSESHKSADPFGKATTAALKTLGSTLREINGPKPSGNRFRDPDYILEDERKHGASTLADQYYNEEWKEDDAMDDFAAAFADEDEEPDQDEMLAAACKILPPMAKDKG